MRRLAQAGERLVVDAFARYRITDPLKFYQTVGPDGAELAARDSAQLGAAARARRGDARRRGARQARGTDGADARSARSRRAAVRHPGRRRAHPPRRSAGAEQPGGLSAHADRTAARGGRVPRPRQPEEPGNPRQGRSRRDRAAGGRHFAVRADPRPGRRRTQPHLRRRLWPGSGISSPSIAPCRPTKEACSTATRGWCCGRIRISSAISAIRRASRRPTAQPAAPPRPPAPPSTEPRRHAKYVTASGSMSDFLAALGLFFVIEGILFAAFPLGAKRAMAAVAGNAGRPRCASSASFRRWSALLIVWLVRLS